jgi:hypothetical protein
MPYLDERGKPQITVRAPTDGLAARTRCEASPARSRLAPPEGRLRPRARYASWSAAISGNLRLSGPCHDRGPAIVPISTPACAAMCLTNPVGLYALPSKAQTSGALGFSCQCTTPRLPTSSSTQAMTRRRAEAVISLPGDRRSSVPTGIAFAASRRATVYLLARLLELLLLLLFRVGEEHQLIHIRRREGL